MKLKRKNNRERDITKSLATSPVYLSFGGPQSFWHKHIFKDPRKLNSDKTNFTSRERRFHSTSNTAEIVHCLGQPNATAKVRMEQFTIAILPQLSHQGQPAPAASSRLTCPAQLSPSPANSLQANLPWNNLT